MNKRELSKILGKDYDGFVGHIENVRGSVPDFYVEVDDHAKNLIEGLMSEKREIDAGIKALKGDSERVRGYMLQFMEDRGVDKFVGVKTKSITYQPAKQVVKTTSTREIMVGREYQPIDSLSKEDLIAMLEKKGVKTRTVAEEETVAEESSIRVIR